MQPQLPSSPTGTNWVTRIDPAWIKKLLECVGYAMTHPRGDGVTILTQDGGTLRAKQSPASAPGGGGGGDAAVGVITAGPSGGYGAATWQPCADDLTPGGATVPVVVLPLK